MENKTEKVLSIHQPNYLPWLGYFYKIYKSDVFVILDNVQYVKNSIANRNKIKNNKGEAIWLTVPVKISKGHDQNYNEIKIDYEQKWQQKHINFLREYYRKALYFDDYFTEISEIIKLRFNTLAELNTELIKYFCSKLLIETPIYISSAFNQEFGKKNLQNINICKYFEATTYLSGEGAKKYNDEELFKSNNIKLKYSAFELPQYSQLFGTFIPNLSVVDIIFNCGPESTKILKDSYQLQNI